MIPILSGKIESELLIPGTTHSIPHQYVIFFATASVATIAGMICFETAIRVIYHTVLAYTPGDNMILLLLRTIWTIRSRAKPDIRFEKEALSRTDYRYLLLNIAITCMYTSATLAAIYSAYILPQYRVTSLSFAFIINGIGTFIFVTMIDPYISSLTDSAMADSSMFPGFYFRIMSFIWSRLAGVLVSLLTFHLFVSLITGSIRVLR